MMDFPIPPNCTTDRCFSPVACTGFGYCRERNRDGMPTPAQVVEWRRLDSNEPWRVERDATYIERL